MRASRALLIAAVLLTASKVHAAGIVATPPASESFGLGYTMYCYVTNASATQKVTLVQEVRSYSGAVVDSTSPFDLLPGEVEAHPPGYPGGASCVYRIVKGNAKDLRAAAHYLYFDPHVGTQLVVIPAR